MKLLRRQLREMAGTQARYGYRRLTVLLRREGGQVNAKRIYRLYREEGLMVRRKETEAWRTTTESRCWRRLASEPDCGAWIL